MGQSSSNNRNNQNHNRPVSPSQLLSFSSSSSFSSSPTYAPAANYPYLSHHSLRRRTPNFHSQYPQLGNRPNSSYYLNQNHGWPQFHASSSQAVPATPPPPSVEHQKVTTVRNDVNLHKQTHRPPPPPNFHSRYPQLGNRTNSSYYPNQNHGWPQFYASSSQAVPARPPPRVTCDINLHRQTIRLEVDEQNPGTHLVTFTFDAKVDGSITIFYFAEERIGCRFSPLYPDNFDSVTTSFQKGLNQKFRQPIGTGIDLESFVLEDLAKPKSDYVFPLVISAEACSPPLPTDEQLGQPPAPGNAQITEAVIEKKNGETFEVKVVRQLLWVDGVRYEFLEFFGMAKSAETEFDDDDPGKECVICLFEPKDTAVLPCRHLCLCSACAKVLRFQTNRCPICRQPAERLLVIKR